jgi:hypothetical protein
MTASASGHEHPTATAHGADGIHTDGAANTDEQRVAPPLAEIVETGGARDLGARHHAPRAPSEDEVDRPLLWSQVLEGARDLMPA